MPVLVLVTKYIVHTNSRRWGYQGTKVSKLFADQINVKLNQAWQIRIGAVYKSDF